MSFCYQSAVCRLFYRLVIILCFRTIVNTFIPKCTASAHISVSIPPQWSPEAKLLPQVSVLHRDCPHEPNAHNLRQLSELYKKPLRTFFLFSEQQVAQREFGFIIPSLTFSVKIYERKIPANRLILQYAGIHFSFLKTFLYYISQSTVFHPKQPKSALVSYNLCMIYCSRVRYSCDTCIGKE